MVLKKKRAFFLTIAHQHTRVHDAEWHDFVSYWCIDSVATRVKLILLMNLSNSSHFIIIVARVCVCVFVSQPAQLQRSRWRTSKRARFVDQFNSLV